MLISKLATLDRSKYGVIDSHTAGAPTRLLYRGAPKPRGSNMMQKKQNLMREYDHVRTALMQEPRGNNGVVAIPVTPTRMEADVGLIFADYRGYVDMCIHGTIGVVTTLVECGLTTREKIKSRTFVFDTPAGLVRTSFELRGKKKVSHVRLANVPSFYFGDQEVVTHSFGRAEMSIAFGGNIYGYVDAARLGLKVRPESIKDLLKAGREILAEAKELDVRHEALPNIRGVLGVSLYESLGKFKTRNIMIAANDLFDRSPCGTGTCGRMAVEYAKGRFKIGDEFESRSVIDSVFYGRVLESRQIEGGIGEGIMPEIKGTAYVTGACDVVVSDVDPLSRGFLVN